MDCRVALQRARVDALLSLPRTRSLTAEAARLEAEAEAALAARAAGVSQWGSELPPPFLLQVLVLLQWEPAVCGAIRAVCSTWCSLHDALLPHVWPMRSMAVMDGKLGWFESVTAVDLTGCEDDDTGELAKLASMPSLRSLWLPASCAERAVDAEAVYGLTTLTTLCFHVEVDEDGEPLEEAGEWVLNLSRLPSLTCFDLEECVTVTDKEVQALSSLKGLKDLNLRGCVRTTGEGLRALSSLTALTDLNLGWCDNATAEVLRTVSSLPALIALDLTGCENVMREGLRTVSSLPALTNLNISWCDGVNVEGLRAVTSLTALTALDISGCNNVNAEGLRVVSSLTALSTLYLSRCDNVTDEGLQTLSSLTALTHLSLYNCPHLTAAGKQALHTALPNLTILD
jgi:hypothetical protein